MSGLEKELTAMEGHNSVFEREVRKLPTWVCGAFLNTKGLSPALFKEGEISSGSINDAFPKLTGAQNGMVLEASRGLVSKEGVTVAVLFSGGPAAGGHNVVAGIKNALGSNNTLLGIRSGPKGLLQGDTFEITEENAVRIFNTGGFDFLGSDRTKIKTAEQFEDVSRICKEKSIEVLVIIGGDDSNTNAAMLAEHLFDDGVRVIGVPKTIDGDLQVGDLVPISFGFDTATKIYSEMVGNLLQDTPSSRKYWHFVKLMGRSASHVTLEVALQTRPPVALISEEIAAKGTSLAGIARGIAETVLRRAAKGINHGLVLIPEGLVEFVPEMKSLIEELNEIMAGADPNMVLSQRRELARTDLSQPSAALMDTLPGEVEEMLLLDRDSHGNLKVSQIPTEKLLILMVEDEVAKLKADTDALGKMGFSDGEIRPIVSFKFATLHHFFGYEGRCGAPSMFDAAYTFNLGMAAGSLALSDRTGYIVGLKDLDKGGVPVAVPLPSLIKLERRHGKDEPVIEKALVELDSPAFKYFESRRVSWASADLFTSPGPRQLWGPSRKQLPATVALNRGYPSLDFDIGSEFRPFDDDKEPKERRE